MNMSLDAVALLGRHRTRLAMMSALLLPLAGCALLVPIRGRVPGADAVLVLVVLVLATASLGHRLSGVLAAVSASVWFDFFLVRPYYRFAISSAADIATTGLLLVVGVGVTELAGWGRRSSARVEQQAGYLAGLHAAAGVVVTGGSPTQLAERVATLLIEILDLAECHFRFDIDPDAPTLQHDGSLSWGDALWDIEENGFPQRHQVALTAYFDGRSHGRFVMTALPQSRPSLDQRLVAAALAAQVGAALNGYYPKLP